LGVTITNIKLSGLLAIGLIIAGCISFAAAYTITSTNIGSPTYTTLADPFSFPTPTATPSPTPEPTTTPIPTPKPEPTAKPTITINCISTASASNLKVEVTGTLTYNKTGIPDASIYLGFSADYGNRWENFSLTKTRADGGFGTLWIPNATGNYLLNAQWEGNATLHWVNATVSLVTMPDLAGNEFSVVSNSTISNFAYNLTTQELSFNTNGTQSTTGYAHVCILKTLVSDIQTVKLNIDGHPVMFTSESQDDVWVVSCAYSQSEHAFTVQIPFAQVLNPATTPWIAIVIAIAVLIAVVALGVTIRRRRRTAATVAAILKENRPIN
jgi:hypothetical protein